jgi:stage V sporulation protein R
MRRKWRLFQLYDDPAETAGLILVEAIHDERGYRRIRRELARAV